MPEVIAENQWLVAINKPSGLIAHSDGRTEEPSLSEWIGQRFPQMKGVGGDWVSPQGLHVPLNGLVHRLDRTTSGVILAAKTQEAFEYLRSEFKEKRVEKKYLAYVYGKLEGKGTIVAEIMRSSEPPKRWYARPCEITDPRAAITDWRVVKGSETASLIELSPKTGRTHQIRVHLASVDHPIVADHLYAPEREPILGFSRPALHASAIALQLPDGNREEFMATLPKDFEFATL